MGSAAPCVDRRMRYPFTTGTAPRCSIIGAGTAGRYSTRTPAPRFQKTRRSPTQLVLLLRGICQGTPTAQLARELGATVNNCWPCDTNSKAWPRAHRAGPRPRHRGRRDVPERGEKGIPHPDPDDPPRRRANKRRGRGTFGNDWPPVVGVVSRDTRTIALEVANHCIIRSLRDY